MKITKAMIFKFLAAVLVPGGFIIWGIHEYSKIRRNSSKVQSDSDKT